MRFSACLISAITGLLFGTLTAYAELEYTSGDARNALEVLDEALEHRTRYIERRQASIDSLVNKLAHNPDSASLMMQIAERYTAFNNDSALHYLSEGLEHAPLGEKVPFLLKKAVLLPLTGDFRTAQAIYDSVNPDSISPELLPLYLESGRQMYSYMATFSPESKQRASFNEKSLEMQRLLIEALPKDSQDYRYHLGEYYFSIGQRGKSRALLEHIFDTEPTESNLRARAAHHLSTMARDKGDENAYIYFIAEAALADITAATREVAALQELGNYLFGINDVDRSYEYLTIALASAVECGASLRVLESTRTLPLIERAKTAQIEAKKTVIYVIGAILIILIISLAATLLKLRRDMKRMRQLQEGLRQANRAKNIYIGQFLNLCSIYMDKLNQLCQMVNRKIDAGKVDDLYKLTKSGKLVEEESQEFYEVFDTAFLNMYPDFPARVNRLLRDGEQIELKEGEQLNTDLRILAFLRMGIDDSSRIAQVLNYSINTIYAYRNRIKARAIDRDSFESDIMQIE